MIHEILLALTGLPSSVIEYDVSQAFHPSEKLLLQQVHEFGATVSELSTRINASHRQLYRAPGTPFESAIYMTTPAIVNVFEHLVLRPYLKEISSIESAILSKDAKIVNGENIIALSSLVAHTVQSWERLFDYALSVLKYLEICLENPIENTGNVFTFFEESIGYAGVDELRKACIDASLKVWLQVVSSWVLYGHNPELASGFFNEEPIVFFPLSLPEPTRDLIYTTGGLMNQMSKEGAKISLDSTTKLELVREVYLEKLNCLKFPVHAFQIKQIIMGIRRDIILKTASQYFSPAELKNLFNMFRNIVLFGDSLFAQEFAKEVPQSLAAGNTKLFPKLTSTARESGGSRRNLPLLQTMSDAFQRALKSSLEDPSCTPAQRDVYLLAQSSLVIRKTFRKDALYLDTITGVNSDLDVQLNSAQEILLQTSKSERIYQEFFSFFGAFKISIHYLTSLWSSGHLRQQSTQPEVWLTAHRAKLFADILWEFLQSLVIDGEFSPLFKFLNGNETQAVIIPDDLCLKHDTMIITLHNKLLVQNEKFASLMTDFMLNVKVLYNTFGKTGSLAVQKLNDLMENIYTCIEEIQLSDENSGKMGLHILLLRIEFVKEPISK